MNSEVTNPNKTVAAFIHLSTFTQFIFPFGNFLFPLILWTVKRRSPFVDNHGKQALNFQISLFLYVFFLVMAGIAGVIIIGMNSTFEEPFYFNFDSFQIGNPSEALPLIIFTFVVLFLFLVLLILNIYAVISATLKASDGDYYKYPLTINFLGADSKVSQVA